VHLTLIAIGYLDLKYLPPPYLKPSKTHFWGHRNVKPKICEIEDSISQEVIELES